MSLCTFDPGTSGQQCNKKINIFYNNTEHKKASSNATKDDDKVRPNNIKLYYLTLLKYHDWERCLCAPLTQVGYLGSAVQQQQNIFYNNTEHKKAPSNAPTYDDKVRPNNIKLYYLTLLKYHDWERCLCAPLTQVFWVSGATKK